MFTYFQSKMGEHLFQLEITELNSVLGSMEIGKPETLDVMISRKQGNIQSKQVEIIEIIDDFDLENCNNNTVSVIKDASQPIKQRKTKKVKRDVSLSHLILEVNDTPQVESMDIVRENPEISQSTSDNKIEINLSDSFVNCRNRTKRFISQIKYNTLDGNKTIKQIDETISEDPRNEYKRMLRKRIHQCDSNIDDSDKIKMKKPNNSRIEKYYLDKKVKRLPSTLETIFEEPKRQNNEVLYLSSRKLKRFLSFHEDVAQSSKLKSKKRLNKAKKMPSSKSFINRQKVSMESLMNKLVSLEQND